MTGIEIVLVLGLISALIVGLLALAILKGGNDTDYTGGAQ